MHLESLWDYGFINIVSCGCLGSSFLESMISCKEFQVGLYYAGKTRVAEYVKITKNKSTPEQLDLWEGL